MSKKSNNSSIAGTLKNKWISFTYFTRSSPAALMITSNFIKGSLLLIGAFISPWFLIPFGVYIFWSSDFLHKQFEKNPGNFESEEHKLELAKLQGDKHNPELSAAQEAQIVQPAAIQNNSVRASIAKPKKKMVTLPVEGKTAA